MRMKAKKCPFHRVIDSICLVETRKIKFKDLPTLSPAEYKEMKKTIYVLDESGTIYINKSMSGWETYLEYFLTMADEKTIDLIEALAEAKEKYPDFKSEDVKSVKDKRTLQEIGFLSMIPIELQRRKRAEEMRRNQSQIHKIT